MDTVVTFPNCTPCCGGTGLGCLACRHRVVPPSSANITTTGLVDVFSGQALNDITSVMTFSFPGSIGTWPLYCVLGNGSPNNIFPPGFVHPPGWPLTGLIDVKAILGCGNDGAGNTLWFLTLQYDGGAFNVPPVQGVLGPLPDFAACDPKINVQFSNVTFTQGGVVVVAKKVVIQEP